MPPIPTSLSCETKRRAIRRRLIGSLAFVCLTPLCGTGALAQSVSSSSSIGPGSGGSSGQGSASTMWGAASVGSGVGGVGLESASLHQVNAADAGYVQSAANGYLFAPGSSITIQAIGSQSIISNSVYGNNNSATIDATQSASTSGSVTNQGALSIQPGTPGAALPSGATGPNASAGAAGATVSTSTSK